jgi:hypothetical protein
MRELGLTTLQRIILEEKMRTIMESSFNDGKSYLLTENEFRVEIL